MARIRLEKKDKRESRAELAEKKALNIHGQRPVIFLPVRVS